MTDNKTPATPFLQKDEPIITMELWLRYPECVTVVGGEHWYLCTARKDSDGSIAYFVQAALVVSACEVGCSDSDITFQAWAEISSEDYERAGRFFAGEASGSMKIEGRLANVLPGYESDMGLKQPVEVELHHRERMPWMHPQPAATRLYADRDRNDEPAQFLEVASAALAFLREPDQND